MQNSAKEVEEVWQEDMRAKMVAQSFSIAASIQYSDGILFDENNICLSTVDYGK